MKIISKNDIPFFFSVSCKNLNFVPAETNIGFKEGEYMERLRTVYLEEIKNPKEKEVLKLLNERGKCLYGNIFKELSISSVEGQHIIFSLLSRGLIKYQYRSSNIELNVRLQ